MPAVNMMSLFAHRLRFFLCNMPSRISAVLKAFEYLYKRRFRSLAAPELEQKFFSTLR